MNVRAETIAIAKREQASAAFHVIASGTRIFRQRAAFTLLEVIVAFGVFFLVAFSVLEMVTRSLAAARSLQQREPDCGLVAAMLSLTNQIEEGVEAGDFEDLYPGLYPGWHWESHLLEVSSNGLFQADIVIHRDSRQGPAMTTMSILLYRPESPPGSATPGALGSGGL